MRETYMENNTGSVTTKACFLDQHYPGETWEKKDKFGLPTKIGVNRVEIKKKTPKPKKPRAKMYKKCRKFRDIDNFVFSCGEAC